MREETIGGWLDELASAAPAPGGGAVAAMHAAMAAALVEMVCNLTIGKPKFADHEATMIAVREESTALRTRATVLAGDDAIAFTAVTEAYRLPKETDEQKSARQESIQRALARAADVPSRTADVAHAVVVMAERIVDRANPNVLSDVAVAASSVRASLESAIVNIEINRTMISDPQIRESLASKVDQIEAWIAGPVTSVVDAVRGRIST